jgi:hypothetical protein
MSDDNCTLCTKDGKSHGHFSHWKDDAVAAIGELIGTVRLGTLTGLMGQVLFLLFAFCVS